MRHIARIGCGKAEERDSGGSGRVDEIRRCNFEMLKIGLRFGGEIVDRYRRSEFAPYLKVRVVARDGDRCVEIERAESGSAGAIWLVPAASERFRIARVCGIFPRSFCDAVVWAAAAHVCEGYGTGIHDVKRSSIT